MATVTYQNLIFDFRLKLNELNEKLDFYLSNKIDIIPTLIEYEIDFFDFHDNANIVFKLDIKYNEIKIYLYLDSYSKIESIYYKSFNQYEDYNYISDLLITNYLL